MRKHTFIILFLVVILSRALSIPATFSFDKFSYNDKLPSNSVIRTYNDNEGYMWFGTKDGLCRFDGYDIKVFRSSAFTPGKLTNNEIQCITEDKKQRLWVGTFEGINIIDKRNYTIKSLDNEFIKKDRINSILLDKQGFIWIATSSFGLIRMNPDTYEFERYSTGKDSRFKLKANNVTSIYEDQSGRIWVLYWRNGLNYIDLKLNKIKSTPWVGNNNNPFRLFQDKDGLFWICTWGDGIFNMKPDGQNMNIYPIQLAKGSNEVVDKIVYSITQDDKFGLIWVVTFKGINLIEKLSDGTCRLLDTNNLLEKGSSRLFHEISKDHRGNIWLGSVGEGLYKLDFNKIPIQNYPLSDIISKLNIQSYVTRFCETNNGSLYIAINRIGIFNFDIKTGTTIRPNDQVLKSITSIGTIFFETEKNEIWITNEGEAAIYIFKENSSGELLFVKSFNLNGAKIPYQFSIRSLFEDSKKNMWIGTDVGLYMMDTAGIVKIISQDISYVNTINEDSKHNIWAGTEKEGLFKIKFINGKDSYNSEKIALKIRNYESLSVQSICCSRKGNVYAGTKEGCIYQYDPNNKTAVDISGQYGITDEGILDIIEDNNGILWISTIKKIIRYNPENKAATYFSTADGMLVSSFFKDARIMLKTGQILFGGNKGICMFNPSIQSKTPGAVKHVAISDILVQNKSIFDDSENVHYSAENNRVTLKYSENNLSIEFSALDYSSASKIQYAYKLSGVDKNWNYVSNNRRFVNYANMPSGNYTFQVKASDENGSWSNQVTSLIVEILPPLYRSWWAYLIYLSLIITAGYFTAKIATNRIRLRNELKISHIEKEKTEELAQIKLRFFTNISHELLTPLTIIMLLIENLQKKNSGDSMQFDMLRDNVIRLKRLIQQILVFRKTETGNMKLKITENDIVSFVKNICRSNFQPLVAEKKIDFSIDAEYESYMAYFDADKLDKILYNLLSNAFKHTPVGGTIKVKISFIPRDLAIIMRLSVSDTGDGIDETDLPHIFKRFYISKSSDQSKSHGIGLALTNDLLQLHKGNVEVKSQLGEGSVFTIEIPVTKGIYTTEELLEDEQTDEINGLDMPNSIVFGKNPDPVDESEIKKECNVLVVEDNRELNNLIVENLSSKYTVLSAENGLEALEIVRNNEIDLVISDVMMPEMDGLTFCKIMKNDLTTSHINILLLTAKNSPEDRIDCYNAGADSYIAKPFELAVLNARAKNLISKRKQKTDSFQRNHEINISSMEYGSMDELFLKQAVKKVEEKLLDDSYDFDQFALDMATSKSTLHRKLKSLTGLSPGEFIRNIRLKHAALMLLNNTGNISEIAFAVGFNDPKYFSRCFKTEFGLTPREYQESKKI